ncbi:hypothetical protein K490DRAFT_43991 [Saccharata proteae CBS 121410]|uniref:DUF676 domain-containing protein n=1 Tax=Saccharata proteae CBS 121410 TaxID=1314787 RepID=A0A9P4HWN4_9PEZI|nr:hypothetical protein K490DRAFT_43991 [Saccharata proteae CBS 121410]
MPRSVSFIPSQTPDEASFTSSRAALQSPWVQLYNDAITLFSNIRYVPNVFLPMKQAPPMPGVFQRKNLVYRDDTLNTICVAVQILITIISPIILHESLQLTCDRLAATFKRPVTGIHNRSFGMIADVIECIIQRCFAYMTTDVRCCFEVLKLAVLDPEVEKVVAIAHSQGGIVISLTLDRMFAELPTAALNKMEIYTFGSAASHFNNPLTNPTPSSQFTTPNRPTNVLSTIEHYANEFDMVPRWGVLHATRDLTLQRYAGRVFVNIGGSGHLFNDHYLEPMFPAASILQASTGASSSSSSLELEKTTSDANMAPRPGLSPFLDRIVDVDFNTAMRRAQTVDDSKGMGFDETQTAIGEGAGRTVRQLSKLWMYVGGGEPRGREQSNG